jgi:branched-chain amino acid aminotransferase
MKQLPFILSFDDFKYNASVMKAWTIAGQIEFTELTISPKWATLDDLSDSLPEGVYTTFRTFKHTKAIYLDAHFGRLEESAGLLGHPLILDRQLLRRQLRRAIGQFPEENSRIRISIDLTEIVGRIFIAVEKLTIPSQADYDNGVKVKTRPGGRNIPRAKTTSFINIARGIREKGSDSEINEILMVNQDGNILEGLSSNFFGVMDGSMYTAEAGVLSGVTRKIVLEIIQAANLAVTYQPIHRSALPDLEEAFITSASRGVLPVALVDGLRIGLVCPGVLTTRISNAYLAKIENEIEEIS